MKSLLFVSVLLCMLKGSLTADLSSLSAAQLKNLESLSFAKLPKHLQDVINANDKTPITAVAKMSGKGGVVTNGRLNDNNHWCCSINPTKTIVNTYSSLRYTTTQHQDKYHTKCGFLGWKRCSRSRVVYRQSTYYATMYRQQVVATTCPADKVVCCKNYIKIASHCLPLEKVPEILNDLLWLQQQGLLG